MYAKTVEKNIPLKIKSISSQINFVLKNVWKSIMKIIQIVKFLYMYVNIAKQNSQKIKTQNLNAVAGNVYLNSISLYTQN